MNHLSIVPSVQPTARDFFDDLASAWVQEVPFPPRPAEVSDLILDLLLAIEACATLHPSANPAEPFEPAHRPITGALHAVGRLVARMNVRMPFAEDGSLREGFTQEEALTVLRLLGQGYSAELRNMIRADEPFNVAPRGSLIPPTSL